MIEFNHVSVLLNETIDGLNIKKDGIYVDGTIGGAGHSYHILEKLDSGMLIGFDQDSIAIEASKKRLIPFLNKYKLVNSNFSKIPEYLESNNIKYVDGFLFDLGVSSFQLDEPTRGFSYRYDSKLDMRMDQRQSLSAYDVVNKYSLEKLTKILFEYGEEKYARSIANNIVSNRPINTTFELVEIIKKSVPSKYLNEKGHPAKKTFQAIRIEVNQELEILKDSLNNCLKYLNKGGRMCVITFHSLEDRIVKQLFKDKTSSSWHRGMPIANEEKIEFKLVNSKPILATEQELLVNNRSHSAKLRIIEKL